jgi:hypothetical protein
MIEKDAKREVERIIAAGENAGIRLRVLGGLAVYLTCPSAVGHARLKRSYADIDLAGLEKDGPRLGKFFTQLDYIPDQRFNALHGRTRMIFYNPDNSSHVDVFLDRFQMCHILDLRKRLLDGYISLTLADLLITKIQIVEMNEKDIKDILAILMDHAIGPEAPDRLDLDYLVRLTSNDWGLYTTLSDNLVKSKEHLLNFLLGKEVDLVEQRVDQILQKMQTAPKSLRWRARAKIGRRVEWYDLPDEVKR